MTATLTRKYLTVRQVVEASPWLTEHALRMLIFRSEENGIEKCIRRIGRRVLIDADAFEQWVESNGSQPEVGA